MGFLKRIFSIGGRKHKKRSQLPQDIPPPPPSIGEEQRRKLDEEEHEAAVGRLLRSSSSRFAVVKEIDYSNLPPLPHPINDVLAQCMPKEKTPSLHPSRSTLSLASSTLSRHSTYSVTVHNRQRHTTTEFPHANGELDDEQTPVRPGSRPNQASGHHMGLRSDPSVASLIELYDEHGKLPPEAFSNSPPSEKHERQQRKRNGSTLRELLGAPDSLRSKVDNNVESDISWAERFLGEVESVSSHASSYGPHTPSTCTDVTNDRTKVPKRHDLTFSTDISTNITDDPAINSLEVELSTITDNASILDSTAKNTNPYKNIDPNMPQRASQVFSFLTKRNTIYKENPLPDLPSAFSSPSDTSHDNIRSRFSTDGSHESTSPDPRKSSNSFGLFKDTCKTPTQATRGPRTTMITAEAVDDVTPVLEQRKIRVLMTGPTRVIVTAPTPGTNVTPSRIPIRGPRQLPKRRVTSSRRAPMLTHRMGSNTNSVSSRGSARSKSSSTSIPQRKYYRRTATHDSAISAAPSVAEADAVATVCALDHLTRSKTYHNSPSRGDKENQLGLTANMELPATPLRSHTTGRSSLFRKVVTPGMFQPPAGNAPSPTSSSELSPVGRKMMMDARMQRMRMRESEGGRKSGSGRRSARARI